MRATTPCANRTGAPARAWREPLRTVALLRLAEAVAKFAEWHPDLLLLDVTMPVMDGMEALRLIREHDSDATVVMVTALADQRTVMKALKDGASDVISKPPTPEKITRAVEAIGA